METPKIWILGASFETLNMGVSALAESSIKCILQQWPDADITLLSHNIETPLCLTFNGKQFNIKKKDIWFSRNIFKTQNIYALLTYALLVKIIPSSWLKQRIFAINPYFKHIIEADLAFDITAGDSFSDIYGWQPLVRHSLIKWLFIFCKVKFVMLPQTYGPFKSSFSQKVARYLLKRTEIIYSRDKAGVEYVKKLLGNTDVNIQFNPDVAFVLEPEPLENDPLVAKLKDAQIVVGINISGLLHGNYPIKSRFNIDNNYQDIIKAIVKLFISYPNVTVVLIPHVFVPPSHHESDMAACADIHQQFKEEYSDRVLMVENNLDHRQIKYVIGCCDFFTGSRMHSCIAAISQHIPTMGIAYSDKFTGVFESAGIGDLVIDLRTATTQQILDALQDSFDKRAETAEQLNITVPKIKDRVINLFVKIAAELKRN
ncbi:polysaccharide pyruvyl transferase family protein [Candidatus Halobeggiatoa sp. HSG11]|nr:polysaccharide pyruvyl transferase family protein [Candidatus Halobeggiatoa sp. HSG11]